MNYHGLLFILLILFVGCKQNNQSAGSGNLVDPKTDTSIEVKPNELPSIPEALLQQIFLECDFVDYIFYELPFSMSYDKQATIQSALRWVNQSTAIPTNGCKALGRMIFQKKGEIMIEAELYVSETCAYYKWIQNGKPVYNNLMSESGIIHYSGIIKQFENKNQ